MIICSVGVKLQAVSHSLPDWASLRCKGENHPADNEVEEEDGVHYECFAVRRLAVCQEGCRC